VNTYKFLISFSVVVIKIHNLIIDERWRVSPLTRY